MGVEYINRITVKKDGVYISTKSNNDSMPYRSVRIDFLSDKYKNEGEEGLVKELISMFNDYCVPKGTHKSILPFRQLHNYSSVQLAFQLMRKTCDEAYDKLSEKDKDTYFTENKTPAMKKYLEFCKKEEDKYLEAQYLVYKQITF